MTEITNLPLLDLPDPLLIPVTLMRKLAMADVAVKGLSDGVVCERLLRQIIEMQPPHRLSSFYIAMHKPIHRFPERYDQEKSALRCILDSCADISEIRSASELAKYTSPQFSTKMIDIRDIELTSGADVSGGKIAYPSPGEIEPAFIILQSWLNTNSLVSPVLLAVVAMVRIANIHPLYDGNGRLSRTLFNYILSIKSNKYIFLPLRVALIDHNAVFLIYIKEAQLFGRWSGILEFVCAIIIALFPQKYQEILR